MTNEDRVYTFENVTFTAGERNWCVATIWLHLQENAIPYVRLVVDPVHQVGDPVEPATPTSLADLAKWHKRLQELADTKAKASLTIRVMRAGKVDQELELTDWIVTSSGITNASASGSFALEVVIQHPIALLTFLPVNINSLQNFVGVRPQDVDGDNILEVMSMVFRELGGYTIVEEALSSGCYTGEENPSDMMEDMLTKLSQAADALDKYLTWDPSFYLGYNYSNWPLENGCMAEYILPLRTTVKSYITGLSNVNPWEILANDIADEFYLTIVPTYWQDQLVVTPSTPWDAPSMYFTGEDISNVQFPGTEGIPIAGVYMVTSLAVVGDRSVHIPGNFQQSMAADAVYNVSPLFASGNAVGSYVPFTMPGWLINVQNATAVDVSDKTTPNANGDNGRAITPGNIPDGQEPPSDDVKNYAATQDDVIGASFSVAKQVFLEQYRSTCQAAITTRLLIKFPGSNLPGERVIPGAVARISDSGEDILDFYVTTVEHVIDCQGNQAYTSLSGVYARPPDGTGTMVATPKGNPVYLQEGA